MWYLKSFDTLTNAQLYQILRLRSEIFVVEQDCVYQDMDDKDKTALHFFKEEVQQIVAYTRLFKPGDYYKEASIGRVVVKESRRSTGLGHLLIDRSIEQIEKTMGKIPIKIGAQVYLKRFYEKHHFKKISEEYLEDGIPHIHMLRKL
ncbi:MAG: GNAT family N-acetyltransferase [Flavobacteriaceae bacterium]